MNRGQGNSLGLDVLEWEVRRQIAIDEVVAKRGKPSMPKLEFMNGTKWGVRGTDEASTEQRAA